MAKKTARIVLSQAFSNIKVKNLAIAGILIVVIAIFGLLKNQFIAATVNGKPITRAELIQELERKQGKAALDSMITEKLILEEAAKKKVEISDQDIDQELKNIEKSVTEQGQNLDQLLLAQNLTHDELKKQVRIQLLLKKMVGKVEVTEKEVNGYIEKNKDSIPQDAKMEDITKQVKEQLSQQKLNDKIQELIQKLQNGAKIEYLLKL